VCCLRDAFPIVLIPRWLMLAGILMIAQTTVGDDGAWTPDIDAWSLTRNSVLQGFGLGIVFTPLQVVAFANFAVGATDRRDGPIQPPSQPSAWPSACRYRPSFSPAARK